LYVPLASGIVLLVGGIVAAALMLASVNQRITEIGLRRAVGALPQDIRGQFVIETAATIVMGGLGGIAIGYVGVRLAATRMQLGGALSWSAVLIGIAASAVTGVLAGGFPAPRVAPPAPAGPFR